MPKFDTPTAQEPLVLQIEHSVVGLHQLTRVRAVDQVEIQVLEPEVRERPQECRASRLIPVLRIPELGDDEKVLPRDSAVLDGAADILLVLVDMSSARTLR